MTSLKIAYAICLMTLTFAFSTTHAGHDHSHDDHDHDMESNPPEMNLHYIDIEDLGSTGESNTIFLRELFRKYGHDDVMTFEGFEHLLQNLGIGKIKIEDHDIHDHHLQEGFVELHGDHNHTKSETQEAESENLATRFENTQPGHGHDRGHEERDVGRHDHDHHEGHEDSITDQHIQGDEDSKKSDVTETRESEEEHGAHHHEEEDSLRHHGDHDGHRRKRDVDAAVHKSKQIKRSLEPPTRIERAIYDTGSELRVPERKCFTPWEILSTFQIESTSGITKENFLHLCPAIVYQIDVHACSTEDLVAEYLLHNDARAHCEQFHQKNDTEKVTSKQLGGWSFTDIPLKVWGFASVAVLVISLVGLVAVAIVPLMQRVFFNQLLQFLVALAVGSLTGDALLHLLPQALAGEEHGGEGEEHGHIEGTFKGLTVLGGIYFFFIMERLLEFCTAWRKRRSDMKKKQVSLNGSNVIGERLSKQDLSLEGTPMVVYKSTDPGHSAHDLEEDDHGHGHSHEVPTSVAALAWMVIMGDGLHNFSDGLAIGAAFASSVSGGLSTAVAVFCHELPHELGDFAVLLKSGMSVKQALFYNIVSSVLCFLGMFIGVALGNIQSASLWIFAVAGGMFIYIALVDMLPMITNDRKHHCHHFLLHILGLSIGSGIMLLIAIYEDDIQVSVT